MKPQYSIAEDIHKQKQRSQHLYLIKTSPQYETVLNRMKDGEWLTCKEARNELGISRLSTSVIHLETKGYEFVRERFIHYNEKGRPARCTRWRLENYAEV